jgi:hypothetical protein
MPTRVKLSNRGIMCNESCVSCDLMAASHMDIFFVCSKVIECWDKIGIRNIIRELLLGANNFYVMLFDLFTRLNEQDKLSNAMNVQSLWKSLNVKYWDATYTPPTSISTRAHDVLHEWSYLQKAKHLVHIYD